MKYECCMCHLPFDECVHLPADVRKSPYAPDKELDGEDIGPTLVLGETIQISTADAGVSGGEYQEPPQWIEAAVGLTKRLSWDGYFISIAFAVAQRATCDRAQVGCVLVSSKHHILSVGYNGSLPGQPHCDEVGHDMVDGHCIRTTHSEVNAVAQAAYVGVSLEGATAYVTHFPCWNCVKVLYTAGVRSIVYQYTYGLNERILTLTRDRTAHFVLGQYDPTYDWVKVVH